MAYTVKNFQTKKELKEYVDTVNSTKATDPQTEQVLDRMKDNLRLQTLVHPEPQNGQVSIEGPHFPKPHKWYARVEVKDGVVVRVIS